MTEISTFYIGDIVTLKSHPLFKDYMTNTFSKQAPPLMLVKEVYFENNKKRIFSEEVKGAKISDKIKYNCVYFDDIKSEFVEAFIYQSALLKIDKDCDMKFFRIKNSNDKETESDLKILEEIEKYESVVYEYGKSVMFKTSKLESRKRIFGSILPSFSSPDFILYGIKKENMSCLFYEDGEPKKQVSEIFYKVMWYNHKQQKFSQECLPKEFFIEPLKGKTIIIEKKKIEENF